MVETDGQVIGLKMRRRSLPKEKTQNPNKVNGNKAIL